MSSRGDHEREGIRGFVRHLVVLTEEGDRFQRLRNSTIWGCPVEFPKLWEMRAKTLADLLDGHVAGSRP